MRFLLCLAFGVAALHAQGTQPDAAPAAPRPPRPPQTDKWKLALETDPADLKHYREANAKLAPPAPGENRVVFLGDSITEGWGRRFETLFAGKPYIGRGISS